MTDAEVALWRRYLVAKSWFDQACDEKHKAEKEASSWRQIAEWRYRRSTTYIVGLGGVVVGLLLGILIVLVAE